MFNIFKRKTPELIAILRLEYLDASKHPEIVCLYKGNKRFLKTAMDKSYLKDQNIYTKIIEPWILGAISDDCVRSNAHAIKIS